MFEIVLQDFPLLLAIGLLRHLLTRSPVGQRNDGTDSCGKRLWSV